MIKDKFACIPCGSKNTLCANDGMKYCSCFPKINVCLDCAETSSPNISIPNCHCPNSTNLNKVYCNKCSVVRPNSYSPWEWMNRAVPLCKCEDRDNPLKCYTCSVERTSADEPWKFTNRKYVYGYSCRHLNNRLQLTDDISVYASSCHMRDLEDEAVPDFGLYLDGMWRPMGPAYLLGWQDYGLPYNWNLAAQMIYEVYTKAAEGKWVEVGCIAGHGRTGTVLACMSVLAGHTAKSAIDYVRSNYCSNAMETIDQEWWVSWFEAYMFGGTTPGKPAPYSLSKKQLKNYVPEVFSFENGWLTNQKDWFLNSQSICNEYELTWSTRSVRIKK